MSIFLCSVSLSTLSRLNVVSVQETPHVCLHLNSAHYTPFRMSGFSFLCVNGREGGTHMHAMPARQPKQNTGHIYEIAMLCLGFL